MADLTRFLTGWTPGHSEPVASPERQLRDAIEDAGLVPPDVLYLDGKVHRFASKTGSPRDKTGWYVAYGDGVPAGRFGCWSSGVDESWRADVEREFSPLEDEAFRRRVAEAAAARDAERDRARQSTSDVVSSIWEAAPAAPADHPYLQRKGIAPHGLRVTGDGRLIAPLWAQDGTLSSLQYIDADGGKLYHLSGQTGGCLALVGTLDGATQLYLAEGYATAATIAEATGQPCVVAYSASNLVPVAEYLSRELARVPLTIVADHDRSGVGQRYAEQAAAKYGCRYVLPPELGDANDYAARGGDLRALLMPARSEWLVSADDLSSQPAPLEWLIRKWLPRQALAMAFGPSGVGKTFAILDWCLRIAGGADEWGGHRVRHGGVVYLAGEGHHGLRARVAAWRQHYAPGAPLRFWASSSGCDLDADEGYIRVRDAVRSLPETPALIVVDTLHRFLSGSENDAQDARKMIVACDKLRAEFGATVLLVHHSGASEEAQDRARGSTAWRGAVDVEISIVPADPGAMTIRARKMKDAEQPVPLGATLHPVAIDGWTDEDGEPVGSVVLALTGPEQPPARREPRPRPEVEAARSWERAWWASGAEDRDGHPYLSRSALAAWCAENGVGKRALDASKDGLVGLLLSSGALLPHEHGWKLTGESATALILARGPK